jgi:SsrA-binding protein
MKELIRNKIAYYNFSVLEEYEAGIILTGNEVKSIREGSCTIIDSFVYVKGYDVFIKNMIVPQYKKIHPSSKHVENREKKLLLKKKEITKIVKMLSTKGITCIPLSFYNNNNKIKVKIGICKGKKEFEKRETIKKRDHEREIRNYV